VKYDIKRLGKKEKFKAIIANSGNENVCVKEGPVDAEQMCKIAAKKLKSNKDQILCESTGIIGKQRDIKK